VRGCVLNFRLEYKITKTEGKNMYQVNEPFYLNPSLVANLILLMVLPYERLHKRF